MNVGDVVGKKGTAVVTIAREATVAQLVGLLAEHNIGAVVVSGDGHSIDGIVTERDVVRRLADRGADVLAQPVAEIMTTKVVTAGLEQSIEEAAHTMTYSRIRHLPVIEDGTLSAIISIGDVVKYRIDQLTDERNHLLEYLHN